jgi:hypothetical protein
MLLFAVLEYCKIRIVYVDVGLFVCLLLEKESRLNKANSHIWYHNKQGIRNGKKWLKGKVKVTLMQALRLCTGRMAHRGSRGIALLCHDHGTRRGWGVSVTPRPLFTPGKTQYPLYRRLGGPQGRSLQVRNISPPLGFDPRTVQLVASRYTDWATQKATKNMLNDKIRKFVWYYMKFWGFKC